MNERADRTSWTILAMNTLAFTVCFAAWMMYGVLIAFLINNGIYEFDAAQMGWLIGIPVPLVLIWAPSWGSVSPGRASRSASPSRRSGSRSGCRARPSGSSARATPGQPSRCSARRRCSTS